MRKIYWYLLAYLKKHGLKAILVVAIGVGCFSLLLPLLQKNFAHRTTHYIAIIGEYDLHNLPPVVKDQLSLGLMEVDTDGSFLPALASELTIDSTGTRYVFSFNQEHYWHDGKIFSPADVVYPLQEVQVTASDTQLIYQLPAVSAAFPQHLVEPLLRFEQQKRWWWQREMVYGLGKVSLLDYTYTNRWQNSLSQVVLFDHQTKERWIYRFYHTQAQAITAYKLGEVDVLFEITNLSEIKDWETTLVQERLLPDQYLVVFFNCSLPQFTRSVRQALSYALEKERAGYTRAPGPIAESSWAYFKGLNHYEKNLDLAIERLLDNLPEEKLELNLTTTTAYYDIASQIKKEWEDLGAKAASVCRSKSEIKDKTACEYLALQVNVQTVTFPDTNNFQTLLIGQQVTNDPDQYGLWHSDLATNFTHYKNTKVDSLLEKGRQTIDTKERLAIYQDFQQNLLDDPPAIFLWNLKSYDLVRY